MWAIIIGATTAAIVGSIVTRIIERKLPPPPQKVVLVTSSVIEQGDLVLVSAGADQIKVRIVELDPLGDKRLIRAVIEDETMANATKEPLLILRSSVISKVA